MLWHRIADQVILDTQEKENDPVSDSNSSEDEVTLLWKQLGAKAFTAASLKALLE
jgi:hypothetical protein